MNKIKLIGISELSVFSRAYLLDVSYYPLSTEYINDFINIFLNKNLI